MHHYHHLLKHIYIMLVKSEELPYIFSERIVIQYTNAKFC